MTRIITPELNKKLKKEYTLRFFIILFFSIAIVFLIHIAFAASSYLLLSSYENLYQDKLAKDNNDIFKQNKEFISSVNMLDTLSNQLEFNREYVSPINTFDTIRQYAGSSILIKAFEMYEDKKEIKITMRAIAKTREDLLVFDSKMKTNTTFSDFIIPIDTFAKQKDIPFDVTFTYYEN